MVVIAIVGIFAALAAPSFSQILASQRNSSTATELLGELDRARSEAIKYNTTVSVCQVADITANLPSCVALVPVPGGADWSGPMMVFAKGQGNLVRSQLEGGDLILWRGQTPHATVRVLFSDATEPAISFGPDGARIGSALSASFMVDARKYPQPSSFARCVLINAIGQFRVGRYARKECQTLS